MSVDPEVEKIYPEVAPHLTISCLMQKYLNNYYLLIGSYFKLKILNSHQSFNGFHAIILLHTYSVITVFKFLFKV